MVAGTMTRKGAKMAKAAEKEETTVIIEIPFADLPEVAWAVRIDTRLTYDQGNALRKITEALDQQQARLASGKRVVHPTDAVKYLLEQASKAIV